MYVPKWKKDRKQMFAQLMAMNKWPEQKPITLAEANGFGVPNKWFIATEYKDYDLRTVLPNECVFDIGDHVSFSEALYQSFTLWEVLQEYGVPHFWGALSGGSGLHTHVFVEGNDWEEWVDFSNGDRWLVPSNRKWFVSAIMGLFENKLGYRPDVDPGHLHPTPNSKIVREFGARKKFVKTLAMVDGVTPLQQVTNREDAYRVVGVQVPTEVRVNKNPIGIRHVETRTALGGTCPRSTACYRTNDWHGFCEGCPTTR